MSKAKLIAARELIKNKKYNEARTMLTDIDDPTARKWLAELDRIAPARPISRNKSSGEKMIVGVSSTVVFATISIILFVTFLIAVYGAFLRPSKSAEAQTDQQWDYVTACFTSGNDMGYAMDGELNDLLFSDLELNEYLGFGEIPFREFLGRFGNDGWEMVSFVLGDQFCEYILMFKKRV